MPMVGFWEVDPPKATFLGICSKGENIKN